MLPANAKDFAIIPHLLIEAGDVILQKRNEGYQVNRKDDGTFVTSVDLLANQYIKSGLKAIFGHDVRIVSEENEPWENHQNARGDHFLIDPIDGTSFFIRGGDFCINVAYLVNNRPVFGAICIPTKREVFFNIENNVYKLVDGKRILLAPQFVPSERKLDYNMINNRRSINLLGAPFTVADVEDRLSRMRIKITSKLTGVAAIKYCMLLEGTGDFVVSLGTLRCWDIAAANALSNAMGMNFTDNNGDDINLSLSYRNQVVLASGYNLLHRCLIRSFKEPY